MSVIEIEVCISGSRNFTFPYILLLVGACAVRLEKNSVRSRTKSFINVYNPFLFFPCLAPLVISRFQLQGLVQNIIA